MVGYETDKIHTRSEKQQKIIKMIEIQQHFHINRIRLFHFGRLFMLFSLRSCVRP